MGESIRPLILVSNDDGIASPGLWAVVEAVAPLADVLVVAPKTQQTATGRSFVRSEWQIEAKEYSLSDGSSVKGYMLDATPAQAVRAGILLLAERRPDLLISGINYGENIGLGVTISGTVGAAIEAASFNIPALAISLETPPGYYFSHSDDIDFSAAGHFAGYFARMMLSNASLRESDIIKVEVPASATPETPWRLTRLTSQNYFRAIVKEEAGVRRFDGYARNPNMNKLETDSDGHAIVVDQIVAVTPLTIDLTNEHQLNKLREEFGH